MFKWKGEIGPSFLVLLGQTIGAVVAVTMLYSSLSNTVTNTASTADRLGVIVQRVENRNGQLDNRLVKVETSLDDLKTGVAKLGDKLDIVRSNQKAP